VIDGKKLKAMFFCSAKSCAVMDMFDPLFRMLHDVGGMLGEMTPAQVEETVTLVNNSVRSFNDNRIRQLELKSELEQQDGKAIAPFSVSSTIACLLLLHESMRAHSLASKFRDLTKLGPVQ
jgi:hypothetical protein